MVAAERPAGTDAAPAGTDAATVEKPAAPARASRAPVASSTATRHVMQANRSKNTKPELLVRRALREAGLPGYRLHRKGVPGHPDVCYVGRRVAIFVNGCYWHHCPHCQLPMPKSNVDFWRAKFERNRARDARDRVALVEQGWTVVVVWECQLKGERLAATMERVVDVVRHAGEPGLPPRVFEVGSVPAWRARRTLARHRRGRR